MHYIVLIPASQITIINSFKSIYMPCAILLIIPVRKLDDDNESISWDKPDKQNVERTEQTTFRRTSLAHAQTLFSSVFGVCIDVYDLKVLWVCIFFLLGG